MLHLQLIKPYLKSATLEWVRVCITWRTVSNSRFVYMLKHFTVTRFWTHPPIRCQCFEALALARRQPYEEVSVPTGYSHRSLSLTSVQQWPSWSSQNYESNCRSESVRSVKSSRDTSPTHHGQKSFFLAEMKQVFSFPDERSLQKSRRRRPRDLERPDTLLTNLLTETSTTTI